MSEEQRKRQEVYRALLAEAEHNARTVFQFHTPVPLATSTHSKFEDQLWLLPAEIAEPVGKVYGRIRELNDLILQSNNMAFFRRNDLWSYLKNDLRELERTLRDKVSLEAKEGLSTTKVELTKGAGPQWDLFICHASEDKVEVARPLAETLTAKGLKVWYDEFTLKLGDSLSRSIDYGLANSRFGVVILSPSFFKKEWPRKELDGLTAKEISSGKVILPIWHKVDREYVLRYSPILADKLAVSTGAGLDKVVDEIMRVVKTETEGVSVSRHPSPPAVNDRKMFEEQLKDLP